MVKVVFKRSSTGYAAGEAAFFPEGEAATLVRLGAAEYAEPADPGPTPPAVAADVDEEARDAARDALDRDVEGEEPGARRSPRDRMLRRRATK